jgi:hypothetical protein
VGTDEWPPQFVRAHHVRDLTDENMVVSFGLFDGTAEDYRQLRTDERAGDVEDRGQRKMSEFVDQVVLDGVVEVIDEVTPAETRPAVRRAAPPCRRRLSRNRILEVVSARRTER